jgi:pimeloyl-ACP methyl ester carboxylesterase
LAGPGRRDRKLLRFALDRCWRTDQAVMARRLELLQGFDFTDRLGRVQAPTLLLAGDHDVMVPLAEARLLAEGLPQGELTVLPDAGHLAALTHAEAVARALAGFRPAAALA